MTITYLHLKHPINGKKKILSEESFVEIYLGSEDTTEQLCKTYELPYSLISNSVRYWQSKYGKEIASRKHNNYAKVAFARTPHTTPEGMKIFADRDTLESKIAEGKSEWQIAQEMNLAPQTLRKSIRKYHLSLPTRKMRVSESDYANLEWLEQLSPGIVRSYYNGTENPNEFFSLLYESFVKVCRIMWTIHSLSHKYSFYKGSGKVEKSYISWRPNKHEIIVSEKLRELGVEHIRDYFWAKNRNFSADLYLPHKNMIVEIDGDVHEIGRIKSLDKEKTKLAKELGYLHLRISTKEVDKSLEEVIKKILEYGE